jgi:hypothetical protein
MVIPGRSLCVGALCAPRPNSGRRVPDGALAGSPSLQQGSPLVSCPWRQSCCWSAPPWGQRSAIAATFQRTHQWQGKARRDADNPRHQ